MSEYWVSKKKYWCQYCETFIADDAPSRTQHETGLRHKGNKERYIRSLYKAGIKKKQDSEEEKRAMKFVDAAAQAAFAQDVSSGSVEASHSASTSTSKPKTAVTKPADPFVNYTTAQSLGIEDPDVGLQATEEIKKSEGIAGEWVAVVAPTPTLSREVDAAIDTSVTIETSVSGQVRKRNERPVDEEDTRQFKLRKKTAVVGLGEIYDPGVIDVKPRTEISLKKENVELSSGGAIDSSSQLTERPVWVSRGWKKAGEPTSESTSPIPADKLPESEILKQEEDQSVLFSKVKKEEEDVASVKLEQPNSSDASLFRKRKVPVNSNTGKRKDR